MDMQQGRYCISHRVPLKEIANVLYQTRKTGSALQVDWPARQQSKLETALQNSYMLATLVSHLPQESPALIGMARVVSDGAFNAQLWDVIVDPSFQVGPWCQLKLHFNC